MSTKGKNLREMFEQRVNSQGGSGPKTDLLEPEAPITKKKGFWSFNVNTILMVIVGMVVIGIVTKMIFMNREIKALESKIDLVRTSPEDLSSFVNRGIEERLGMLQNLAKSTTPPCIPVGYGAPPTNPQASHPSQVRPRPQAPPAQAQPQAPQARPAPQPSQPSQASQAHNSHHGIPDPPATATVTEDMENLDDVMRLAQQS
jgi:hypothetical protein